MIVNCFTRSANVILYRYGDSVFGRAELRLTTNSLNIRFTDARKEFKTLSVWVGLSHFVYQLLVVIVYKGCSYKKRLYWDLLMD